MPTPEYFSVPDGPSSFGSSYYGAYAKCPRLFWHIYVNHTPRDTQEDGGRGSRCGTLVHTGLRAYYSRLRAVQQKLPVDDYPPPGLAMRAQAEELGPDYQAELERGLAAVERYRSELAVYDRLQVVYIEQVVQAQVGTTRRGAPVVYNPRVDLVSLDQASGALLMVDHKTTSVPKQSTFAAFSRSLQFIGMDYLGRRLASQVPGCTGFGGVLLNVLMIVEPYRPIRPPLVDVGDEARASFPHTLVRIAEEIEDNREREKTLGRHAWRTLDAADGCQGRYQRCPYWNSCLGRKQ